MGGGVSFRVTAHNAGVVICKALTFVMLGGLRDAGIGNEDAVGWRARHNRYGPELDGLRIEGGIGVGFNQSGCSIQRQCVAEHSKSASSAIIPEIDKILVVKGRAHAWAIAGFLEHCVGAEHGISGRSREIPNPVTDCANRKFVPIIVSVAK